jgi:glutamate synthase domain-containing protein 2
MGTEHQPGILARGVGFAALLAIAVVIAILMATGVREQLRSIASGPTNASGPSAAVAYEPR